jgi:hypothetical protein
MTQEEKHVESRSKPFQVEEFKQQRIVTVDGERAARKESIEEKQFDCTPETRNAIRLDNPRSTPEFSIRVKTRPSECAIVSHKGTAG